MNGRQNKPKPPSPSIFVSVNLLYEISSDRLSSRMDKPILYPDGHKLFQNGSQNLTHYRFR